MEDIDAIIRNRMNQYVIGLSDVNRNKLIFKYSMMVDYKLGMDQIVWDIGVVMRHRYAIYGKPEIASLNY